MSTPLPAGSLVVARRDWGFSGDPAIRAGAQYVVSRTHIAHGTTYYRIAGDDDHVHELVWTLFTAAAVPS